MIAIYHKTLDDKTTIPVEVDFEQGDLIEVHDHLKEYGADGVDKNGNNYIGSWIEVDGEFSEIDNIEEA